jgi:lysophospholipase L1-like esterase
MKIGGVLFSVMAGTVMLAATWLLSSPAHAQESPDSSACSVPPALIRVDQPLLRTATRLGRRPFRIVAIGSSSTEGAGASGPEASYPAVLARELNQRFPNASIAVFNKGVGGERIDATIARFEKDVVALNPDLVIWQVGTNDATANDAIDHFEASLLAGIQQLKIKGKDLILMSPQFSPRMNVRSNQLLYIETIRSAAQRYGIQLFRRFDIMNFWVASGQLNVPDLIVDDGLHMTDLGYYCTAVLLADMIETAAKAGESVMGAPHTPLIPPARPAANPGATTGAR